MDNAKFETQAVAGTSAATSPLQTLSDIELALVGGGQGDVSFG